MLSIRNLGDRSANLDALHARNIDGNSQLAAKVFRNSEFFRLCQVLIMWLLGLLIIILRFKPLIFGKWIATHVSDIASVSLCLMATILTWNIYYFGTEGRKLMGNARKVKDAKPPD